MYNERWFSRRTIMLSDEWHVRFGFVHVAFSLPSHAIGDLLYKKRMRGKKKGGVWQCLTSKLMLGKAWLIADEKAFGLSWEGVESNNACPRCLACSYWWRLWPDPLCAPKVCCECSRMGSAHMFFSSFSLFFSHSLSLPSPLALDMSLHVQSQVIRPGKTSVNRERERELAWNHLRKESDDCAKGDHSLSFLEDVWQLCRWNRENNIWHLGKNEFLSIASFLL